MSDKPRRRVRITIKLQADSWVDAGEELESIGYRLSCAGYNNEKCLSVTVGGASAGYTIDADEDETITHESYFSAVEKLIHE
jgi:hypothetical protein